ncbi:biliverdin-producing heme oxygenase [Chitinophaga pendula]|uniref:biliverdin-producing heme oxygenase n=1 Tax=Chitinophaga TaxID=79328 RepID=UPI000BAEAD7E|nr:MULTISPECIES: biliverdin-producing heme oxygenase [Chitinophaga]ASZ14208.1 heme oxygenase [Chitinophaga sp. MD30]UCJ08155.1 biliverdin-producing heme oxygenase [Chitinophaga pendula]
MSFLLHAGTAQKGLKKRLIHLVLTEYSFSDHIKEFTKKEHQELEKELVIQIKSIRNIDEYIQLLGLFYHYYTPIEQLLEKWLANDERIPDYAQRRKSAAILNDINACGYTLPVIGHSPPIPAIDSFAAAIGAAYVMEGSTLGGTIIAKMISTQLDIPATKGFSFFNGYGDATRAMWERFRAYLNALATTTEQENAAATARNTFVNFKIWANSYGPVFKI